MPDAAKLAKAELIELDSDFNPVKNSSNGTKVQFNPDSLKVSLANQIVAPPGTGDQSGPQAQQFVGAGTTKLAVSLSFDVTSEFPQGLPETDDVRNLTKRVAYFITPVGIPKNAPKKYIPPAVRFSWGSFTFDGIMESLEETLELFSFEGRPLRATVAVSISQQRITEFKPVDLGNPAPPATRRGETRRGPVRSPRRPPAPACKAWRQLSQVRVRARIGNRSRQPTASRTRVC